MNAIAWIQIYYHRWNSFVVNRVGQLQEPVIWGFTVVIHYQLTVL